MRKNVSVKNEAELHKLGLTLDPSNSTKAVPLSNGNGKATKSPPNGGKKPFTLKGLPDPSWTEKQLVDGARYQWKEFQAAEKKAAVHVFRLGAALILLKSCLKKRRKWGKFLKDLQISEATAWRATELFTRAKTEDQVALLPITEAYVKFGIVIQPEIPADKDDDAEKDHAAEAGHKKAAVKKSVAKEVKAKKTLPKHAKDSTNKDEQEVAAYEEVDQDDDFDSGELFDEFSKRNNWDQQRQVQAMAATKLTQNEQTNDRVIRFSADLLVKMVCNELSVPQMVSNAKRSRRAKKRLAARAGKATGSK